MMTDKVFDQREFRNALGNFATGVTVVTTKNKKGEYLGVTANSFASVSMDPPMVLWSLDKRALSLTDYQEAGYYTVNVLAEDQVELSNRFASQGEDKYAGVDFFEGKGGCPVIAGAIARFQCQVVHQYEGGDHIILVGQVLDFDKNDDPALLFHKGRYCTAGAEPI